MLRRRIPYQWSTVLVVLLSRLLRWIYRPAWFSCSVQSNQNIVTWVINILKPIMTSSYVCDEFIILTVMTSSHCLWWHHHTTCDDIIILTVMISPHCLWRHIWGLQWYQNRRKYSDTVGQFFSSHVWPSCRVFFTSYGLAWSTTRGSVSTLLVGGQST